MTPSMRSADLIGQFFPEAKLGTSGKFALAGTAVPVGQIFSYKKFALAELYTFS